MLVKYPARKCAYCGSAIAESQPATNNPPVFCSQECRKAETRERREDRYPREERSTVPTGTLGAIHELKVCALLMSQGWHTFRAMSPCCPCDLVIFQGNMVLRIEVTTGIKDKQKSRDIFPKKSGTYIYDFMAVVFPDGDIAWVDPDGNRCFGPEYE